MTNVQIDYHLDEKDESVIASVDVRLEWDLACRLGWWLVVQGVLCC